MRRVSSQTVFTTHTPVPAGHDRFSWELIEEHLGPLRDLLGISAETLMGLGRVAPHNMAEDFCMTVLALKNSRRANAVSSLHGQVSRTMWTGLHPGRPEEAVPIGHITNGVHVHTWLADGTHRMRVGVRQEGTKIDVQICDADGRNWRTAWSFDLFDRAAVTPLGFGADPDLLYINADHDGRRAVCVGANDQIVLLRARERRRVCPHIGRDRIRIADARLRLDDDEARLARDAAQGGGGEIEREERLARRFMQNDEVRHRQRRQHGSRRGEPHGEHRPGGTVGLDQGPHRGRDRQAVGVRVRQVPDRGAEDALLTSLTPDLKRRFQIQHATLQIERDRCAHGCEDEAAA